ncbi:SURF1 family protein [soil metagenome]
MEVDAGAGDSPRSPVRLYLLCALAALASAGVVALGIWQLERRVWKLDLISQIDRRVGAPLVDAPGPARWPVITASTDAYRHVRAAGTWLTGRDTLVQAVTALGSGYWLMTPLRTDPGFVILINRGFVPPDYKTAGDSGAGSRAEISGLLRITEPKGGFLRSNDAAADRWYARDIAAIAEARGLTDVAPYFIDAAATPGGAPPVGGLTVINLPNNHLVYAITWFVLAAMAGAAGVHLVRGERARVDRAGDHR